jgi:hypothetical protein
MEILNRILAGPVNKPDFIKHKYPNGDSFVHLAKDISLVRE